MEGQLLKLYIKTHASLTLSSFLDRHQHNDNHEWREVLTTNWQGILPECRVLGKEASRNDNTTEALALWFRVQVVRIGRKKEGTMVKIKQARLRRRR